jgi:MarR family transcriptional regulator, organic hydroperoxide resistance regulator
MAKDKVQQPSIAYLIHRIAVRLEDSINAKARKYGLRIGEIRVLMRILSHGALSAGALANMTSIEQSALSHLLRRLTQEGWVTRRRSEKDNRLVHVELTERGRHFAEILQPYIRKYNDAATSGIEAGKMVVLRTQLEQIYRNIVQLDSSLSRFPEINVKSTRSRRSDNSPPKFEL